LYGGFVPEYPDEALLRDTIAQQPNNVTARHRLAELLLETGRGEEALLEAQAGLGVMPDHPGLLGIAVMASELGGQTDLARRYARVMAVVTDEALRSDPSLASAAATVRWGRRISDDIGDADLSQIADMTAPQLDMRQLEIDLTDGQSTQPSQGDPRSTEHPSGKGESRWPLPRRLRPGRKMPYPHEITVVSPRSTFGDVAGMTDLKWRLQGLLGAATGGVGVYTGGLMLFGPNGCGKTFLTDAIAGQLGMRMLKLNLHDVVKSGDDNGTEMIRSAFSMARKATPCLLVLEDIDALSDPHKLHARRVDLLAMRVAMKLDESLGAKGLTIVATSSAPWRVDNALRAVGRLDRGVFVSPPDLLARGRIFVDRLSFLPIGPDVNPGELAVETEGLTAKELIAVVSAAAEHALCVSRHSGTLWTLQQRDLRRALERIEPSSREWFTQAHGEMRSGSAEVDGVYDYIRRNVRSV
jgi:ATPase family associated with various cellular activities (AAA)